jgi:hypothetical protein
MKPRANARRLMISCFRMGELGPRQNQEDHRDQPPGLHNHTGDQAEFWFAADIVEIRFRRNKVPHAGINL